MKKTNFFSAKTLAMVACVSLMFTSCDEENFSVTPVDPTDPTELPDASVIVDKETGKMTGIDYEHCKGCGVCTKTCPFGAYDFVENK